MSLLKNPFIAFLKLIRVENLLIIAYTMYAVWDNSLDVDCSGTFLSFSGFGLLILSTVLIAAAGYIINDYFDVKTDTINHPETVVIDRVIKRRWAMMLHIVFSSVGFLLGAYVALKCHALRLVLFQVISILLLWFYSTHFKKQLLVGNIVVSLLTAAVPMMPWVYEYFCARHFGEPLQLDSFAFFVAMALSAFAFLTSFTREIIKDMEDYKGDVQTGCRTMPIEWGMITSKVFTFFLVVIVLGLLGYVCVHLYLRHATNMILYILFLVVLPLLALMFMVIKAATSRDFKMASLLLKFVMLSGITFIFFI